MSKLKNYTTTIDAHISMARVEKSLVDAGAIDISKSYTGGVCSALKFKMNIEDRVVEFLLPANIPACYDILVGELKKAPIGDAKLKYLKQAEKVSWKILHDWVLVQLSMIQLDQVKPLQVFLAYVWDEKSGQTFYQLIESKPNLLPSGKG